MLTGSPLHFKAFFDVRPLNISGHPYGRESATNPVSKNIFADKYLSEELKGEVYKALILPTLLCGCEAWSLRKDLLKRLRSFHNRCARSMCRVNLHHTLV